MDQITLEVQAVECLVDCEEALAVLYTIFAEKYPEITDFWSGLAHDEYAHQAWAEALAQKVQQREAVFREGYFTPEAYQTFLEYLHQRINEARNQRNTLFAALSVALDIESTIVERSFYDIFTGDTVEVKRLLEVLSSSAKEHYTRVKAMWAQYRPSTPL